ncbi:MAG: PAS domain S-box protein, partial [Flavobacteriales bacterium]|nr:PAS domain S-box protein [Flavobacteriales bacterium]
MEKALKESEERFRRLSEASFEGVAIHEKGKILDASNKFAEMFGYKQSEVIGKTAKDFIAPEHLNSVLEKIEARDGKPYLSLALRKDGSTFPIEIQGKQALYHGKEARITSVRDITERKEAEKKLDQKTKLMQLLQEIAVTANEAASIEIAMNICLKNICSFTGWPVGHVYEIDPKEERLIPTKIWHFENEESFETFRKVTEVTFFDRDVGLPGKILKSGKPLWIQDVTKESWFIRAKSARDIGVKSGFGFPVLEGKKVVAVLEFYSEKTVEPDRFLLEALANLAVQLGRVTERKRAEEMLIKNENLFRNYFELGQVGMAITSPDQKWLKVNDRICEILGYSKEELKKMTWTELTHPDDLESDLVQFKKVLFGEIDRYEMDKRFIHKNGKIVHVHLTIACQRNFDGAVDYTIASLQDISERKKMEDQIKASLNEKEILLREIHHRVKNNMQVMSSLLKLQSDSIKDERAVAMFDETYKRIKSMSII